MLETTFHGAKQKLEIFRKETLINGEPGHAECVQIDGQSYSITRGLVTVIGLEEEWYEDVLDPESVVNALKGDSEFKPDIFTFWQRLPAVEPKYGYYMEWESLAALEIKSFDYWWNKQVKGTTRNMIRKSEKAGVQVRECSYDDEFVRGMTEIFNETPVRQGRQFWHYGKDFETIKRQFSRYLFREDLIGAYCDNELAGFVMLANAGNYGVLGQFISKIRLRDKAINNALIAHTVKICAERKLPYLVYGYWAATSLADFKRYSGFEERKIPRYFVPLTQKGKLALKLGLHHGLKTALPSQIKVPLKRLRKFWCELRGVS
jgi:hypothetical protein